MSAYETTTCRHCLGSGCIHCEHRGYFSRRLHRRNPEAVNTRRILLGLSEPKNIIAFPVVPQEAA